MREICKSGSVRVRGQRITVEILWHRRGNQAANGENRPQPVISEETGLLDSNKRKAEWLERAITVIVPYRVGGPVGLYTRKLEPVIIKALDQGPESIRRTLFYYQSNVLGGVSWREKFDASSPETTKMANQK